MPKRVKYRKSQRGRIKGKATQCNEVSFGQFGLQALESGWIAARQLEAGRVAVMHFIGTEGRMFIRIFPHKSVTAKPAEVRMGTGKGDVEYWAAVVRPGTMIFEVAGLPEEVARQALARCAHKMPVKTKFVIRGHRV
jgi:large subunit ribosomal protein L16